jgi:hypothetical protein
VFHPVVNAVFCFEPGGDTPTRSHFYLAALSGCIPVIFDGGLSRYDATEPTWWAWRKPTLIANTPGALPSAITDLFFDYREVAVVYNASEVMSAKVDVVQSLRDLDVHLPEVLLQMRRRLAQVSKLMTYSMENVLWLPWRQGEPGDAFAALQGIVARESLASRSET